MLLKLEKAGEVSATLLIFGAIALGVYSNVQEKRAEDASRLPRDITSAKLFTRWTTNLKNKGVDIEVQSFKLVEEQEAFDSMSLEVFALGNSGAKQLMTQVFALPKDKHSHIAISPDEKLLLDYRFNEAPNAHQKAILYGEKDGKLIKALILECKAYQNCYFDRAYFLTDEKFVIHEFSLKEPNPNVLTPANSQAPYSIKTYIVDLGANKMRTYESETFDLNLAEWIERNKPKQDLDQVSVQ